MLKKITFIIIKFFVLWIILDIIVNTGIFLWEFIVERNKNLSDWSDNFISTLVLVLLFISIGSLIKKKFPSKNKFFYSLRWGLIFILFPVIVGYPYITQSQIASFYVIYLCLLFFLAGFMFGFFDFKYKVL